MTSREGVRERACRMEAQGTGAGAPTGHPDREEALHTVIPTGA